MLKKGITIAEILVSIAIFSVLLTGWYVLVEWSAAKQRDVQRITDVDNIDRAIKIEFASAYYSSFKLDDTKLNPDDYVINTTGDVYNTKFNKNTYKKWGIVSLTKIPKDPLTQQPYVIGVYKDDKLDYRKKNKLYNVWATLELDPKTWNLLLNAYVVWNYTPENEKINYPTLIFSGWYNAKSPFAFVDIDNPTKYLPYSLSLK